MYGSRWLNDVIAGCVRPRGSLDTVVRLVSWLEPGRPSNCGLIPGGGKGLLLLNVQTCSGAHPASCSMGIGLCFLSGTATGLTNRPSGAEVKNEWSHTCAFPYVTVVCTGTSFPSPWPGLYRFKHLKESRYHFLELFCYLCAGYIAKRGRK